MELPPIHCKSKGLKSMALQDATKAEFHLRADELHTRLVAEARRESCLAILKRVVWSVES